MNKTTVNALLKNISPELKKLLKQFTEVGSFTTCHRSSGNDTLTICMKQSCGSVIVKR